MVLIGLTFLKDCNYLCMIILTRECALKHWKSAKQPRSNNEQQNLKAQYMLKNVKCPIYGSKMPLKDFSDFCEILTETFLKTLQMNKSALLPAFLVQN